MNKWCQLVFLSTFFITVQQIQLKYIRFTCTDNPHLGKLYCAKNSSVCLYDTEQKQLKEFCINETNVQIAPTGPKYVWTGGRRNIYCSAERFQPFGLPENLSDKCLYQKSLCGEDGQIIYKNESSSNDRTCGCDHRLWYGFVTFPESKDFCVPFEEDCSCVVNTRSDNEISDYSSTLGERESKNSSKINRIPSTYYRNESTTILPTYLKAKTYAWIPATITLVFFIMTVMLMLALLWETFPDRFFEKTSNPKTEQIFPKQVGRTSEKNKVNIHSNRMTEVVGESVTLKCHIPKNATIVSVKWFINGSAINISRNKSKYSGSTVKCPSLRIIKLTPKDTGKYECRMTDNAGGEIRHTTDLIVQVEKPRIIIKDKMYSVISGSTVTLQCTVLSKYSNLVSLEWFIINNSGEIKQITNGNADPSKYKNGNRKNQSLIINNFRLDDEGNYICKARNEVGTTFSDTIIVYIKLDNHFNRITEIAGGSVTLKCHTPKYVTVVSVKWFFHKSAININLNESKYSGSTVKCPSLSIINLTPKDTGKYECRMTDNTGKEIRHITHLTVQVEKPRIIINHRMYSVITGSTVTLQCIVVCKYSNLVSLEWFLFNDYCETKHISNGDEDPTKYKHGTNENHSLTINNFGLDDQGNYICLARNEVGSTVSDTITVTIKSDMPFIFPNLNYQVGDPKSSISVSFTVEDDACIIQQLDWFLRRGKNETKLEVDECLDKYTVELTRCCSLTIHKLTQEDAGIYRCQVTTKDGTASNQSTVSIRCLAPIILPTSLVYTIENDKKAVIVFMVISDPEATVNIKNGSKFVTAKKIKLDIQYACLYCIETYDPGIYKCMATNAVGKTEEIVTVKVYCGLGENIKMIVALDIGSTFSRCAFSMTEALKSGNKEVYNCHALRPGDRMLEPTCILVKKPNNYIAFGNEAISKYEGCLDRKDMVDHIYLQKFKHAWYKKEESLDRVKIAAGEKNEELSASDVYIAVIKALKKFVISEIQDRNRDIQEDKILWVFTIPSIWYAAATEFLLERIKQIEIDERRLIMVLESFAATKYATNMVSSSLQIEGAKFLVVDIGGCTCQISAVQRVDQDELEELCPSLVVPFGGDMLDKAILNLLDEILGEGVMDILKREEAATFLYIIKQFEKLKHNHSIKYIDDISLQVEVLDEFCKRVRGKSFSEVLEDSGANDKISLKENGKLCINREIIDALFQHVSDEIVLAVTKFLFPLQLHDITKFLLVGGFCNSVFIRDAIKKAFPKTDIINTDDSDFCVAKGAVLCGIEPNIITTRVAQYTYGRRIHPIFNRFIHDPTKKVKYENGEERCKNVFEAFLQKGEIVPVGKKIKLEYYILDNVNIAIYMSGKEHPMYTDEKGCKKLCEFQFCVSTEKGYVDVELEFGKTKLHLKAVDRTTNDEAVRSFPLI